MESAVLRACIEPGFVTVKIKDAQNGRQEYTIVQVTVGVDAGAYLDIGEGDRLMPLAE